MLAVVGRFTTDRLPDSIIASYKVLFILHACCDSNLCLMMCSRSKQRLEVMFLVVVVCFCMAAWAQGVVDSVIMTMTTIACWYSCSASGSRSATTAEQFTNTATYRKCVDYFVGTAVQQAVIGVRQPPNSSQRQPRIAHASILLLVQLFSKRLSECDNRRTVHTHSH